MVKGLIVDDSKFMRRIIREALENGGHEIVAEAENGNDGIENFKVFKPDFITMDITMGGKDGRKAAKEIMDMDGNARIIVVSALNEKTITISDNETFAAAYVTKPFDNDSLLKVVNKILENQ